MLRPLDGAPPEAVAELRLIHPPPLLQRGGNKPLAGMERRFFRGGFEFQVPGADILACVASVDPAFESPRHIPRNRPTVFDRKVGKAEVRINNVRFDDRTGRARLDAERARAAPVLGRDVGIEVERREDFSEEDP